MRFQVIPMLKKKSFRKLKLLRWVQLLLISCHLSLKLIINFWEKKLAGNHCTDEFLPKLHLRGVLDMIPEVMKVVQIFRSIQTTSCSSERAFSSLGRVNTYLRITIGQDRLSSIALINMECEYSTLYAMRIRLKLMMFLGEGVEEHSISFSSASNWCHTLAYLNHYCW